MKIKKNEIFLLKDPSSYYEPFISKDEEDIVLTLDNEEHSDDYEHFFVEILHNSNILCVSIYDLIEIKKG